MRIDAVPIQVKIIRPLVILWIGVAAAMMGLVLWDMHCPSGRSPIGRFFNHIVNRQSQELKAALAVESQLPPDVRIFVTTDNRYFFYLLRYRLYPSWVVSQKELPSCKAVCADSFDHEVVYRKGVLEVTEVTYK